MLVNYNYERAMKILLIKIKQTTN